MIYFQVHEITSFTLHIEKGDLINSFPPSPTEAAFHRAVYEFQQSGLEQQKEDGLEELTVSNMPSHDPEKPIGGCSCVCVCCLLEIHTFILFLPLSLYMHA